MSGMIAELKWQMLVQIWRVGRLLILLQDPLRLCHHKFAFVLKVLFITYENSESVSLQYSVPMSNSDLLLAALHEEQNAGI